MEVFGLVVLALLVAIGVPMWLSILAGSAISLVLGYGMEPHMMFSIMYDKVNVTSLLAVPLFFLAGEALYHGGASRPLVQFFNKYMGHIPGGPAYAVILACTVMAAMSSTAMAAVAGFGPIMVPMMEQMGYSRRFAIGLLVSASSLGVLIPPSIPLIIFGFVTETSVKDLYSAAFIPGALMVVLLALTVFIHTRRGHYSSPPPASWRERWDALKTGLPVLMMPVAVLVPIYVGWVTATESAVVAAVYSILLGFIVYRELTVSKLWSACVRVAHLSSMLFAVLAVAFLLNLVLVYMKVPMDLGDALSSVGFNWMALLALMVLLYLVMGAFLDSSTILIVMSPILLPAVVEQGISPVLFGVLTVISVELAAITPPYGITLFAASGVLREKFSLVARACFMFYPALIVGQLLIAFFHKIALWLPGL
ncbi:MAG: TRAP transporter large permease [Chloroflexi bacterium]|nr:TRAP transporter large permease [Chloroflexota bacterium]